MSDPIFAATARARRSVADLPAGLDAAQLDMPSPCAGWSVKVVAGHLTPRWAVSRGLAWAGGGAGVDHYRAADAAPPRRRRRGGDLRLRERSRGHAADGLAAAHDRR